MSRSVACPACSHSIGLPPDSAGKALRCPACGVVSRILLIDGALELQRVERAETTEPAEEAREAGATAGPAAAMPAAAVAQPAADSACAACGASLSPGDRFCTSCGQPRAAKAEAAPLGPGPGPRPRPAVRQRGRGARNAAKSRAKAVGSAGIWMATLAVLFILFGTAGGLLLRDGAKQALWQYSDHSPDEVVMIEGEEITVAELRKELERAPLMVFLTNYILAAVFIGLLFWARKSPVPALATALCLYLAVVVLTAMVGSSGIMAWLFRGFVVMVLVNGLRAAIQQRNLQRRHQQRLQAHAS